jgi:hypothetical protein
MISGNNNLSRSIKEAFIFEYLEIQKSDF